MEIVTLKRDTTVLDTIRLMTADTPTVDTSFFRPIHIHTLAMAGGNKCHSTGKDNGYDKSGPLPG